jgi:hypothetical protein
MQCTTSPRQPSTTATASVSGASAPSVRFGRSQLGKRSSAATSQASETPISSMRMRARAQQSPSGITTLAIGAAA